MNKVDYLILQSTQSGEGIPVTKADIIDLHTADITIGGYGFNRPGIDYLVQPDGSLETLIAEHSPTMVDLWGISEGKEGILGICKHIAYVGGKTQKEVKAKDTRTKEQEDTLEILVKFYILKFPHIRILGFDEAPAKKGMENPGFEVATWLETIGTPERNIFKQIQKQT